MTTARILVDPALCSGCRACEVACSFGHEGVFGPGLARIRVVKVEEEGYDRPVVCHQCRRPPCAQACPTGALTRDEAAGRLRLDDAACIGCGACVEACPFGAMRLHPDTEQAMFCDLCGGDPACVKRCTPGAIFWGREEDFARRLSEARARREAGDWWSGAEEGGRQ
ncbi:MAG: 4Fe-4S dicluster domain-containing protein [Bacillota bacterium]|nr:4Fe-4S dicluster domain-containing protein [Bacillota bacterium]